MTVRYTQLFSIAVLFSLPLTALAQPPPQQPPPPPMQSPPPPTQMIKVSSAEVHEFAQLYIKVQEIRVHYLKRLQSVKNAQTRQNLQHAGNQKIKSAISKSPLGSKRYEEIGQAAAQDMQLRQRLIAAITKIEPHKK